ncbi:MAG: L-threonylcarbamoyladenylate synthase [archaeon]
MVQVLRLKELTQQFIVEEIKAGKIFIYPTDTLYGIGCDATNIKAVRNIRKIKRRSKKPFSVIAPSKKWITSNFKLKATFLKKLPGPFTYILKPKNKQLLPKAVLKGAKMIGVRIPKHKFTTFIQKSGKPFVTTSVNISGQQHIFQVIDIPKEILEKVDYVIDDGVLANPASTILDFSQEPPSIIKRQ